MDVVSLSQNARLGGIALLLGWWEAVKRLQGQVDGRDAVTFGPCVRKGMVCFPSAR